MIIPTLPLMEGRERLLVLPSLCVESIARVGIDTVLLSQKIRPLLLRANVLHVYRPILDVGSKMVVLDVDVLRSGSHSWRLS